MRFCFIIEEQYKNDVMPMAIIEQLHHWQHSVDILEPRAAIMSLCDLPLQSYDAYILKTVSDGPGLSILEAAEATGIPTINTAHAIRLVRDKAVATALAQAHGIPVPQTYFVAHPSLLEQVPLDHYPLVVKPTNGSSGRGIYLIRQPEELTSINVVEAEHSFFLAQCYIENTGFDIKLYVMGKEVYSVAKKSPLHPQVPVDKQLIPITFQMRNLALRVGKIFGLDIYGLDIVETPHGPVVVDINDFPSFGLVPNAIPRVATHILRVANRARYNRQLHTSRMGRQANQQEVTPRVHNGLAPSHVLQGHYPSR
jgi:ribosomal protein S6--L-glutamate ligase